MGLSTPAGGVSPLFERQLDAVGQGLQDAERPDPVGGAVAHLHSTQDLALQQDGHQNGQQQESEDRNRFDQDQPPRIAAEHTQIGRDHEPASRSMRTTVPGMTPSC